MFIFELIIDKGELFMNQLWVYDLFVGYVCDFGRGEQKVEENQDFFRKGEGNRCCMVNYQYFSKFDICYYFVINNKDDNNSYYLLSICCGQVFVLGIFYLMIFILK